MFCNLVVLPVFLCTCNLFFIDDDDDDELDKKCRRQLLYERLFKKR